MAGITSVTQETASAYVSTGFVTEATQVTTSAYVSTAFSSWATQVTTTAYVWTAFKTQVTQLPITAWVITCDSSSYTPPAGTGVIVLTATAAEVGTATVNLSWGGLPGFTYTLTRGTTSGGEDTTLLTGSLLTSYADTGLEFFTTYYYKVVAVNACTDATTSNEASATPLCTLPGKVLRLHATANNQTNAIDLIWNPL